MSSTEHNIFPCRVSLVVINSVLFFVIKCVLTSNYKPYKHIKL